MNASQHAARARRVADAVSEERLWRRHMDMAELGAIPGNGVNRQALSAEDIEARLLLIRWARIRNFLVAQDAIGNLFIRRAGRDPTAAPVLTGSHLDSQPNGGRFDGTYGVLAGFEALEALDDAGVTTERPIDIVAWTNEEGSRFAPGAMGSMVFAGARALEECLAVTDGDGVRFEDALAATLEATPVDQTRAFNFPVAAYVEAHIEQGPRLEAEGVPIGVVTGIQGARWFEVEVLGESAHAGTAPLSTRRDAVQGAIAIIQALNRVMVDDSDTLRFTVGRFDVTPNSPNTVASRVLFSVDLRHPQAETLRRLGDAVHGICANAAARCEVRVRETFSRAPCQFDADVQNTIEQSAGGLALPSIRLPSGAFHDAQFLNDVCPSGMIFVPCEKGVSHNPAENADRADLAAGTRVLTLTLLQLAAR